MEGIDVVARGEGSREEVPYRSDVSTTWRCLLACTALRPSAFGDLMRVHPDAASRAEPETRRSRNDVDIRLALKASRGARPARMIARHDERTTWRTG